jgi:hypothetical protein
MQVNASDSWLRFILQGKDQTACEESKTKSKAAKAKGRHLAA